MLHAASLQCPGLQGTLKLSIHTYDAVQQHNHCWLSEKLVVVVEVMIVLDELYSCSAFTGSVQSRLVLRAC